MSNEKKYGSRFGTVLGLILAGLLLAGILTMIFASLKGGELASRQFIIGLVMVGASIVGVMLLPLFPSKLRGVDELPRKARAMQIMISVFTLAALGGFVMILVGSSREPANVTAVVTGVGMFLIGFAADCITAKIRAKMIQKGEIPDDSHVVMRAESDVPDALTGLAAVNKLLGHGGETLSPEERERELRRIEEQDRMAGIVHMTKEQVEEYEKRKRGL
ncbi:MAG: hypothetical protein NC401_17925 [Ruminococcus sp.]|nr:hypothetical protein [Ruminococcus sp.]